MNIIPFEAAGDALADEFCQWFAGWTDAVGEFYISAINDAFLFAYRVCLPISEAKTLEYVQQNLKFGNIRTATSRHKKIPVSCFEVKEKSDIAKMIALFEVYALRSTRTSYQFHIWHQAFEMCCQNEDDDSEIHLKIEQLVKRMNHVKKDATDERPTRSPATRISDNQLPLFES
jgi:hypothetical protein